jgi:hypothetical protein
MHVYMLQQLAADRVDELASGARQARNLRALRAVRDAEAGKVRARREWRVRLQELFAR